MASDDTTKRTTVQVVLDGFDKFRLRDFREFAEKVQADPMLRDALRTALGAPAAVVTYTGPIPTPLADPQVFPTDNTPVIDWGNTCESEGGAA